MISYTIMAHPARAQMVEDLSATLDHPHQVVWDDGEGRWDTGRRAWMSYDPRASWHVVIQDDAILCENFAFLASSFLLQSPDQPVSFYLGAGRPRQDEVKRYIERSAGAVEMPWLLWGVCVALPTAVISGAVDYLQRGPSQYDRRLSVFFEDHGISTRYSWPSLADHRDEESLVHLRVSCPRKAHWFADNPQPKEFV